MERGKMVRRPSPQERMMRRGKISVSARRNFRRCGNKIPLLRGKISVSAEFWSRRFGGALPPRCADLPLRVGHSVPPTQGESEKCLACDSTMRSAEPGLGLPSQGNTNICLYGRGKFNSFMRYSIGVSFIPLAKERRKVESEPKPHRSATSERGIDGSASSRAAASRTR